jgi:acyl-CoA synthetase (AMP-forming)/AMP-acid ligase II/acyl carrier protein
VTSNANTIATLVRRAAHRDPAALAILAPGRSPLAYGALVEHIDLVLKALAACGCGRGARVALALPNGPELAVAVVAVACGAQCAPFNPALDVDAYLTALRALRIDALIVPAGDEGPAVRAARELARLVIRMHVGTADPAGTFRLVAESPRPPVTVFDAEPDDIALVLQTSGTTAAPKVVPFPHASVVAQAYTRVRSVSLVPSDRALCVAPLHSAMALRRCVFPVLAAGANVVCPAGFDADAFFGWLDAYAPTFYAAVPAVHRAVLDAAARRGTLPRTSLRFVSCESATLPVALERELEHAFGVPAIQGYGLTETGLIVQTPLPRNPRREGSVGVVIEGELAIVDAGPADAAVPRVGEIAVRGPTLFAGYENDAEANRAAFRDGWFRTGDLGFIDNDGHVFVVGRVKELINRGGTEVSPTSVDAALLAHPAVSDAATFAVPHPTLGSDVVSAVVLRAGAQPTLQALRDFAFTRLPAHAVPSRVIAVARLPRNARGKLQRALLATQLAGELEVPWCAPRDAREARVAAHFAAVLSRSRIGAFDNFFELGGDSLNGAQLVNRINTDFGIALDVALLFSRPTVAELALEISAVCSKGLPDADSAIAPRARTHRHDR